MAQGPAGGWKDGPDDAEMAELASRLGGQSLGPTRGPIPEREPPSSPIPEPTRRPIPGPSSSPIPGREPADPEHVTALSAGSSIS